MATSLKTPIKLYVDFISQPSRAVISFCRINKIPHELVQVRVFKGQQKTEDYSQVNPLQKIPTMEEGDFKLSESHTIMRYLCSTRNIEEHWYPRNDAKKRSLIDVYLDWHHSNTRRCTWLIIANNLPGSDFIGRYNLTVEGEQKFVDGVFKNIENVFLKEKKFIGGDQISIADLSAFCEISQLRLINFDLLPYPVIREWMKRCLEFQNLNDVNNEFLRIIENKTKPKL